MDYSLPLLVWAQPEQQLKWKVEQQIRAKAWGDLVPLLNEHPRSDFPPHWDPPPRPGYGEREPSVIMILAELLKRDAPRWFTAIYEAKLVQMNSDSWNPGWMQMSDQELATFIEVIPQIESGDQILSRIGGASIRRVLEAQRLDERRRQLLERLAKMVEDSPH